MQSSYPMRWFRYDAFVQKSAWAASMLRLRISLQILGVLAPGGIFMVPVRSTGRMTLSSRAQPMASSDFARQLLYSAGFEDIQAAQLTSLQEFSQTLPGD